MTNFARQKPGRYGIDSAYINSEKIGTITSAATDTFRFPTPYRKVMLVGASAQAQTPPVVTTGTSTATLKKFVANGGTTVTLSSGMDLEALVANKAKVFAFLSTATEADLTALQDDTNGGDTYFVEVVNGTTIATQPVALYFVLEFSVLE